MRLKKTRLFMSYCYLIVLWLPMIMCPPATLLLCDLTWAPMKHAVLIVCSVQPRRDNGGAWPIEASGPRGTQRPGFPHHYYAERWQLHHDHLRCFHAGGEERLVHWLEPGAFRLFKFKNEILGSWKWSWGNFYLGLNCRKHNCFEFSLIRIVETKMLII